MKRNKKGFSPIILGIIILAVIVIISIVIFATSNSNKSNGNDYDSTYNYEEDMSSKKKLNRKDISIIVDNEKEYDLTKTLRESGISVSELNRVTEEQIVEYGELKNKSEETRYILYNDYSDSIDVNDEVLSNSVTLKPGQIVECWFETEDSDLFGSGAIINKSNSNKNILDCNIQSWKNIYVVDGAGSLNGLAIGESTRDEVIKKYKKYAITTEYSDDVLIECKDGSKVSFRFHDEESTVSEPGTICYIDIEFKY